MTAHKHAALMLQYAQDAMETDKPWERWEVSIGDHIWSDMLSPPSWSPSYNYRRKPKMMSATCADGTKVTWPEPLREAPKAGTRYCISGFTSASEVRSYTWNDDEYDRVFLENGRVHLTKENAVQHSKALVCLNNGSANWDLK